MNIETNEMIQYTTVILGTVGMLAFMVSAVVQTIKELPFLSKLPTSAVAFAVSVILCPLAVFSYCVWKETSFTWYLLIASVAGAFPVYLVATGGWERLREIWRRTKYTDKGED